MGSKPSVFFAQKVHVYTQKIFNKRFNVMMLIREVCYLF